MSDKYIAEKLGLCWHELDEDNLVCKLCGAQPYEYEDKNFKIQYYFIGRNFSQSVPLLKSEAKRAGLWEEFIIWHAEEIGLIYSRNILRFGLPDQSSGIIYALASSEILTDTTLCAQAFEAFLKEREGE